MSTLYLSGVTCPTKKSLKDRIAAGKETYVYSESVFDSTVRAGRHALCGPSAYQRKWYAEIVVDDQCRITKVK